MNEWVGVVGRNVAGCLLGMLAASCSLASTERRACEEDAQCAQAFGEGFSCGDDGFCTEQQSDPSCEGGSCALADTCQGDVPMLSPRTEFLDIDTSSLANDISDIGSCTGSDAPGNDGFFAVEMVAGEKWHFHVRTLNDEADPSLYVLRSCDARTCQAGDAIDVCDAGSDEHLSFVAPAPGRYIIGVDARVSGGAAYQLLPVRPVCGNGGMPEHSETCDDGNVNSGDGCDESCLAELSTSASEEVEPNDEFTAANRAMMPSNGQLDVTGRLGGRCDLDMYAVDVAEGQEIRATMLDRGGTPCPNDAPRFDMQLFAPDGVSSLGSGRPRAGNSCPAIFEESFARGLSAGRYYVRITTGESERPFDYQLRLNIDDPQL